MIEKTSHEATPDAWVGQAKEAISKADYSTALELLRKAVAAAPDDAEARQLLAQTEDASRRHQAAVARYGQILETVRQIETLIDRGELGAARSQLQAATRQHGQQDPLSTLEQRLATVEANSRQQQATELTAEARQLIAAGDWNRALATARESLRLQPADEARRLITQAQTELDRLAEQHHFQAATQEAQRDVERLIEARELARAGQRLRQAIDDLGNLHIFAELGSRIDKAKADVSFRQRVEWAERRANEAEGLIAEAARLSRRDAFEDAVRRLEAAHQLDPSHPDLEQHLATARAALKKQVAERQRADAIAARQSTIRSHLDALRLDEAAEAIRQASKEFAEPQHFAAEQTRLERLREVERSGRTPPVPGVPRDQVTEAEILQRQRTLAAAYSWKQALLYPLRGFGLVASSGLCVLLVTLDLLAALMEAVLETGGGLGWGFNLLRGVVLLVALGMTPQVIRTTLEGRNLLPPWTELWNTRRWVDDLLRFGGLAFLAMLPLTMLLLTRAWHGGLGADSGFLGWLAAALAGWLGLAFIVVGGGAAVAFGGRQILRLGRHGQVLLESEVATLLTVGGLFVVGLLIVILRSTLVPSVPWMGLPLVHLIVGYTLILTPHLIGVLVRRHRLELSKTYS